MIKFSLPECGKETVIMSHYTGDGLKIKNKHEKLQRSCGNILLYKILEKTDHDLERERYIEAFGVGEKEWENGAIIFLNEEHMKLGGGSGRQVKERKMHSNKHLVCIYKILK